MSDNHDHHASKRASDARSSSAKPSTGHGDRAKPAISHGRTASGAITEKGATTENARTASRTSGSHKSLAPNTRIVGRRSVGGSDAGATPATRRVPGGKPLPEIYTHWNLHNFEQIQTDENTHVAFLVNALGSYARPMPSFQDLEQSTVHEFATVARALENTGVGAYLGALPVLAGTAAGRQYIAAAGSIALVEARHAGYLNSLLDLSLDENVDGDVVSLDVVLTPQQVVSLASPFFVSLNGGPPLIPADGFTNPLDLLNFALALEFLEAAFYNINVPNLARTLRK